MYALTEACIQLMFLFILNKFGAERISILEFHITMWLFQCLLIWPIWWVAWLVRRKGVLVQIIINVVFYVVYSYCWFGPVQDAIGYFYNHLQAFTRPVNDRQVPYLDRGYEFAYLNYQLLKHAFRLSWFYLAAFFYNYRLEEKRRLELAVANKELQLKLMKWHLNPSFYFKTINYLRRVADQKPVNATGPILQLAKVMEYVIYEAKEKLIDVKKEIQFLNNYLRLISEQPDNKVAFEMEVTGEHDKLKIAPLLLAGYVDKLASVNNGEISRQYEMSLQFSGYEMCLNINSTGKETPGLLLSDDALNKRLKELYAGRFSINDIPGQFKLSLSLDEE